MSSKNNEIVEYLQTTSIKSFLELRPTKNEMIVLDSNCSVEKAIETLASRHILSAPVRDVKEGEYKGIVDMLDILHYALLIYSQGSKSESIREEDWKEWCADISVLKGRGVRFGITPVKSIMNESSRNPFCPVSERGTLFQLMEDILGRGIHRAPVVGEMNLVGNVISQSDIIQIFHNNIEKFGLLANKSVKDLNLGTRPAIMVPVNSLAIHAFYFMLEFKVSAIAITTPNSSQLVGALSCSDLRSLKSSKFDILLKKVEDFLMHTQELAKESSNQVSIPFSLYS